MLPSCRRRVTLCMRTTCPHPMKLELDLEAQLPGTAILSKISLICCFIYEIHYCCLRFRTRLVLTGCCSSAAILAQL